MGAYLCEGKNGWPNTVRGINSWHPMGQTSSQPKKPSCFSLVGDGDGFGFFTKFSFRSKLQFCVSTACKNVLYTAMVMEASTMVTEVLYMSLAYDSNLLTICSLRSSLGNFIPVCFPLPFLLENMLIILPVIILLHLSLPAWRWDY